MAARPLRIVTLPSCAPVANHTVSVYAIPRNRNTWLFFNAKADVAAYQRGCSTDIPFSLSLCGAVCRALGPLSESHGPAHGRSPARHTVTSHLRGVRRDL